MEAEDLLCHVTRAEGAGKSGCHVGDFVMARTVTFTLCYTQGVGGRMPLLSTGGTDQWTHLVLSQRESARLEFARLVD